MTNSELGGLILAVLVALTGVFKWLFSRIDKAGDRLDHLEVQMRGEVEKMNKRLDEFSDRLARREDVKRVEDGLNLLTANITAFSNSVRQGQIDIERRVSVLEEKARHP